MRHAVLAEVKPYHSPFARTDTPKPRALSRGIYLPYNDNPPIRSEGPFSLTLGSSTEISFEEGCLARAAEAKIPC